MNFTYSENAKTNTNINSQNQSQPNNQLNIKLTQNEINIINKYIIKDKEQFDLFKYNLLLDINVVKIDDIKINNNEDEFIVYINNEKILFSENTFNLYNNIINIDKITNHTLNLINDDNYFPLDYHKNKQYIINSLQENPEQEFFNYFAVYTSNLYPKFMFIKISNTINVNMNYILSKLNMYPTIYKIIDCTSYYYLIIKNETPIAQNNIYTKYILNNKTNIIYQNKNPIFNKNILINYIYKYLYILDLLKISFKDRILDKYYIIINNNIYFTFFNNYIIYCKNYYYITNDGVIDTLENIQIDINKLKYNDTSYYNNRRDIL